MDKFEELKSPMPISDEYGNQHYLTDELARGGQGVVFRTKDADLAIKQPLDASGQLDRGANLWTRFQEIRILPMPARIRVSLPPAILRDEPGYVMRLLSGMKPFGAFNMDGRTRKELEDQNVTLPQWLTDIPDKEMALRLLHYANTGSTHRRLFALSKSASILARLHSAGLVYGDISTNNAFIGEGASHDVWLIDADNMRIESSSGGSSFYTPGYGAPEIVRGCDSSRPRSDCWAFAVMAFKMLALIHPFIGKRVLESNDDEGGWDAKPLENGAPADLDERAYAGYLPFVDDKDDKSNPSVGGLPRALVATPGICRLFQDTFGEGRELPHRRPVMAFWALELTKAFDLSLECLECKMSYFPADHTECPYCGEPCSSFIRARTPRWEIVIPSSATEFVLPHRLFNPFSFEHNDAKEYEVVTDFSAKSVSPVRGTKPLPNNLTFEFVGGR